MPEAAQMTTRIRHVSGKGELYEGTTRILEVTYMIQLHEQAVLEREGRARLCVSNLSVTVRTEPDNDIYPYIGRRIVLRLQDGKQILGAIISLTGVFLPHGPLPDGEF
jgi:hypothetical protein